MNSSLSFYSLMSVATSGALRVLEVEPSLDVYSGEVDSLKVWLAESGSEGDHSYVSLDQRNFYQLHIAASGLLRDGKHSAETSHAVLTRTCGLPPLALARRSGRIDLLMNNLQDVETLREIPLAPLAPQGSGDLFEGAAFWAFSDGQYPTIEGALRNWWLKNITADLSSPILYIEDDGIISLCMSDQLRELGFTNVIEAMKGRKAMEVFRSRPDIRVVLSDYDLREPRTGLDLVREMRRSQPGLRVLFVSGQTHEIEAQLTEDETKAFVVAPKHTPAATIGRILQELLLAPH